MGRLRIDRLAGPPAPVVDGSGRVLLARCHLAGTRRARAVGLLASADLEADEGLWIPACRSVHTLGMRLVIDVVFLDAGGRVVRAIGALAPGRLAGARGAAAALEARAGALVPRLAPGERLRLCPRGANFVAPSGHPARGRG